MHALEWYILDVYLTTFSESVTSKIQNLWGSSVFSKYSKFTLDFKNAAKNSEKVFCFWDNCIWIGIVKLSLLRTGYFSSAANVLTSSPKICHVNKRDFFQLNFLPSDQWLWWRCCHADCNSAWARLPSCLSKGPLKLEFSIIYLTTFTEFVISEIQKLWGSSFYWKCLKFNLDFKNAAKKWETFLCYSDNCIWIGNVKLSLLRIRHFSLVANVLTSSPKIWQANNRHFFEHNSFASDQWIWHT